MKNRSGEEFEDVITDLKLSDPNIVSVFNRFTNSSGVYYSPKAKEGFRYIAAFLTIDENESVWIETFAIERNGTKLTICGRAGSLHIGKEPDDELINQTAVDMVEQWLQIRDE